MKYYIVGLLVEAIVGTALEYEDEKGDPLMVDVEVGYRDGMCGMLPIYTSKKKATKHAKEVGAQVYPINADKSIIKGEV